MKLQTFRLFAPKTIFILLLNSFLYLSCGESSKSISDAARGGLPGRSSDTTAPLISRVTIASGSYSSELPIVVEMSEEVTVNTTDGIPSISVTIDGNVRQATYQAPNDPSIPSTTLNFSYTIGSDENDDSGLDDMAEAIVLNNGVIQDRAGLALSNLSFLKPDNLTTVLVDTTAPTISSVTIENGSYSSALPIVVTMEEAVIVDTTDGVPSISVTIDGNEYQATYQAPNDPSIPSTMLNFSYTIASGENDDSGLDDMAQAIVLNDGIIQDRAGLALSNLSFLKPDNLTTVLIDTTAPTISSVTIADGSYSVLPIVVTMSEPVTVDTTNGVPSISVTIAGTVRNATYQAPADPSVASATLNFSYTAAANENDDDGIDDMGTALSLNSGVIQDKAGHALPDSSSFTKPTNLASILIDTTAPTVSSVTIADGSYSVLPIVMTMSEPVIVDTTNGVPSISVTIAGTVRDATYQAPTDPSVASATLNFSYTAVANESDTDGIDDMAEAIVLNSGVIQDRAGLTLSNLSFLKPSNLASVNVDVGIPSVTGLSIVSGHYADHIDVTLTASEDITSNMTGGTPHIVLTVGGESRNAQLHSSSSGSTLVFRYGIQSGDNDDNGIEMGTAIVLNGGTLQDSDGNDLLTSLTSVAPSNLDSVFVDTTVPSISSVAIADGSYSVLPIVVTMSEPVTVDTTNGVPSISVTIAGTVRDATYQAPTDPSVASATLNFSYTAASNENDDNGIDDMGTAISLNSGVVQDRANNALPDSSSFDKPTNLASVIIDTTAPTISSVTIADGSYSVLPIVMTMSEPVIVDTTNGVPSISVTIAGTVRDATYQAPTDPSVASATLNFSYTAVANESDTDGIDDMAEAIVLNSGVIQDRAGLTLSNLSFLKPSNLASVNVDVGIPSVTGLSIVSGHYADHIDVTLTASEDITSNMTGGTPHIVLTVGGESRNAQLHSSSSGSTLVFRYGIQSGDNDDNGIEMGTAIVLNGGTLQDSDGNDLLTSLTSVAPSNLDSVFVDTTVPSISSVAIADGSYSVLPIVVTMSEPVTVDTTNGVPSISVTIAGTVRDATYQAPTDPSVASATLNFSYTAASNENDDNGIDDMGTAISLNSGVVQDRANNALPDSSSFDKPTNLASVIIDTTAPTISSVTIADGSYSVLPIVVTMSEPVTVDTTNGVPSISVTIAGTARDATYQAPADPSVASATLNFSYTAAANENDTDGIDDMAEAIVLNDGVIQDRAGLALSNLSFGEPGNLATILIDTTAPVISSVTIADGSYSSELPIVVEMSEEVTVNTTDGIPSISVTISGTARNAVYQPPDNPSIPSTTLNFSYTIASNENDDSGLDDMAEAIALNNGVIQDRAGLALSNLSFGKPGNLATILIDTTAPTISSVTIADGSYSSELPIVVEMSEEVTVNTTNGIPSISVTISGTARNAVYQPPDNPSIPSTTLNFSYTIASNENDDSGLDDMAEAIVLNDGIIQDRAGLALSNLSFGEPGNLATILIDTTAPTISSVTIADGSYSSELPIVVEMSEEVTVNTTDGIPSISVTISGTARNAVYQPPNNPSVPSTTLNFSYTIASNENDDSGLDDMAEAIVLNDGIIQDRAGLALSNLSFGEPGNLTTILIDTTAPTISSVTIADGTYSVLPIVVEMNEAVTVDTTNGTPSISVTISGNERQATYQVPNNPDEPSTMLTFSYTAVANEQDTNGIDSIASAIVLNNGVIQDRAGLVLPSNALSFTVPTNLSNVNIDVGIPSVTAVSIPSGHYSDHIDVTVTTNESITPDVTGGTPYVTLVIDGENRNASLHNPSSGSTFVFRYVIQSGENDNDGGIGMSNSITLNGGTLQDGDGNNLLTSLASVAPNNLESVFVDTTAPSIAVDGISVPDGNYVTGANLDVDITFSETVNVVGAPTIMIDVGGTDQTAAYVSGSGSATLTFRYVVQTGDSDQDGIGVKSPIALGSSITIKDRASNDATLTFAPTPADFERGFVNHADTTAPSITADGISVPDGNYVTGANLDVDITFSEIVNVVGAPTIVIDVGGTDQTAAYVSGSGSTTLTFRYVVQTGDSDQDGIGVKSPIALGSGMTIKDGAFNDAALTFAPTPVDFERGFVNHADTTAPSIATDGISVPDGNYVTGNNLDVDITFSEIVNVVGAPTIVIDVGGTDQTAAYVSGSGSATLTFRYVVQTGDSDQDGIGVKSPIALGSGMTIKDGAFNDAALTFAPTPVDFERGFVNHADTTAPSITADGISVPDGNYVTGANLDVDITFSEIVNVVGAPTIVIDVGGTDQTAAYVSGSGSVRR